MAKIGTFTIDNCMGGILPRCFADKTPYTTGAAKYWVGPTGTARTTVLTNMQTPQGFNGTDFVFDGANDFITLNTGLYSGKTQAAISLWMTPQTIAAGLRSIYDEWTTTGGTSRFALYQNGTGLNTYLRELTSSAAITLNATNVFTAGQLVHIIFNVCALTPRLEIFINNVSAASSAPVFAKIFEGAYADTPRIGAYTSNANFYNGNIANILYFDNTLDAARRTELFELGPNLGGLVLGADGVLKPKRRAGGGPLDGSFRGGSYRGGAFRGGAFR
jgi:hypothetical protein